MSFIHFILLVLSFYIACSREGVDISNNPCLETLNLVLDCGAAQLDFAKEIISQAESPFLRVIELSFFVLRKCSETFSSWVHLDELLEQPAFASTMMVINTAISMGATAKEALPKCHERGVLTVSSH